MPVRTPSGAGLVEAVLPCHRYAASIQDDGPPPARDAPGADDESWLTLGRGRVDEKGYLDAWEERLFELTDRLGGEHDGYER